MISTPRYIDRTVSNYLKSQIESGHAAGDATRIKRALQEISKLYRAGYRILQDQVIGVELGIMGLLGSSDDAKVRRWALNALAQLGHEKRCKGAILHALQTYHDDAEVLAAAIAALYRLCKGAATELRKMGFDEQTVTLAALQHIPPTKLDLSYLPLRLDRASPDLIKLGLIVVGLNHAPPNMFEPNHDNATIVRILGGHDDPIVSQYSVWAITENSALGVANLGIDLKNIEQLPTNVRAWVFQLLAIDFADTPNHIDYIKLGIEDEYPDARLGLAVGLKDTFSLPLVPLVLDWFTREMDPEINQQILDHLIRQAERNDAYKRHAIDAFERAGAEARDRMLAAAAGLPLYSAFSEIKYDGGSDLFRGAIIVQNRNITIGNIQGGAISIEGDATQTGTAINTYNAQTLEVLQSRLADAERAVKDSPADNEAKKEALQAIETAKKEPTKDNIGKVLTALEKVELLAMRTLGAGTAIVEIVRLITQASGHG